jgi:hypothetical protein
MNREEKVAYEIIRQRIVNEIDRLESLGEPGSALKRWRRFGAAFSWDPTVYPELLENPTVNDKKLMSLLRNTEQNFMKKWQAVEGIPLHHVIANRTGGDLGLRLPVDVWEEVKQRVFDATGARPGNSQANLNAASQFDERSHLGRYGAKGTVFDPALGLGEAPDPTESPILHGAGTKEFGTKLGKDPVLLQGSAADITEALIPEVTKQQEIYRTVSELPTTQAQRQVFAQAGLGAAFDPSTPIEQIPAIKAQALELGLPEQFAGAWQAKPSFKGGKAVLQALPLLGLGAAVVTAGGQALAGERKAAAATLAEGVAGEVPVVGDIVQSEPIAGGTFADVQRRTAEGLRAKQLQQRAAQARQRGGKVKFGLGSVKFTLPEFGLSELMGLN